MTIDLESLGFTKEELQNRVVEHLARQASVYIGMDEEGNEIERDSDFVRQLNKRVAEAVDESISKLAEKHVLPNVSQYIENLCLTETNKWGEKQGKPMTFVEYLVKRAENYMTEMVNYEGKVKGQDSYSWKGEQTRLTHLVHKHLHYEIERAMKDALQIATSSISIGLQETCKAKLQDIAKALKVEVKTK